MFAFVVLTVVSVQVFLPSADACFAAGVCGGGCAPPPPAPVCVSAGCGPGYGCGQYGCHRMRARVASSKTLKIDKSQEGMADEGTDEQPQTPDQQFMACCIERNLPDSCLSKCSFSTYTRAALQNMYFRVDQCPMQAAADIHFCAAQGRDHRQCCARNAVGTTLAGQKCLTFCDQRPGNVTQLDFTYMACYERFENMKGCFWHDITERAKRMLR
ncbi:Protein C56C10.4 [Aphelenchoides avenae]|nr:Protein C56C10.4 [Aphelenchus avenae]